MTDESVEARQPKYTIAISSRNQTSCIKSNIGCCSEYRLISCARNICPTYISISFSLLDPTYGTFLRDDSMVRGCEKDVRPSQLDPE